MATTGRTDRTTCHHTLPLTSALPATSATLGIGPCVPLAVAHAATPCFFLWRNALRRSGGEAAVFERSEGSQGRATCHFCKGGRVILQGREGHSTREGGSFYKGGRVILQGRVRDDKRGERGEGGPSLVESQGRVRDDKRGERGEGGSSLVESREETSFHLGFSSSSSSSSTSRSSSSSPDSSVT